MHARMYVQYRTEWAEPLDRDAAHTIGAALRPAEQMLHMHRVMCP